MAIVGEVLKVIYEAKGFKSSVGGINAHVLKPNGDILGPFTLNEFTDSFARGRYFFDLNTSVNDPIGEWFVFVNSPNEDANKSTLRIPMEPRGGGSGSINIQDIVDAVWNEPIDDHLSPGSTGDTLNKINTLDIDALRAALLRNDAVVRVRNDEPLKVDIIETSPIAAIISGPSKVVAKINFSAPIVAKELTEEPIKGIKI